MPEPIEQPQSEDSVWDDPKFLEKLERDAQTEENMNRYEHGVE